MTAQLHAAAVLDRLRSSGTPALTVFDGRVPVPPEVATLPAPPYVVVRFAFRSLGAGARPDGSNMIFQSLPFEVTARVYSVAGNGQALRAMVNRVQVALLDWVPSVAGRSCGPMRHMDSFDALPDERTGVTFFEAGDDYRFTSYPA